MTNDEVVQFMIAHQISMLDRAYLNKNGEEWVDGFKIDTHGQGPFGCWVKLTCAPFEQLTITQLEQHLTLCKRNDKGIWE